MRPRSGGKRPRHFGRSPILGASAGIRYYLEPLAWTPLADVTEAARAIDAAERDNVGLVLNFWHLWQAGVTVDAVTALDARIIFGVDFCDSSAPAGQEPWDMKSHRVWPGEGVIPFRE